MEIPIGFMVAPGATEAGKQHGVEGGGCRRAGKTVRV